MIDESGIYLKSQLAEALIMHMSFTATIRGDSTTYENMGRVDRSPHIGILSPCTHGYSFIYFQYLNRLKVPSIFKQIAYTYHDRCGCGNHSDKYSSIH